MGPGKSIKLVELEFKLVVGFFDGSKLYIQYNQHNQYSYHLKFSNSQIDRIRYDNYDDRWPVKSKPHHFHPRNSKLAEKSPMIENPKNDIPLLIEMIAKNKFNP